MGLSFYKPRVSTGKTSVTKPKTSFKGVKMKSPSMKMPKMPKMKVAKAAKMPKIKIK